MKCEKKNTRKEVLLAQRRVEIEGGQFQHRLYCVCHRVSQRRCCRRQRNGQYTQSSLAHGLLAIRRRREISRASARLGYALLPGFFLFLPPPLTTLPFTAALSPYLRCRGATCPVSKWPQSDSITQGNTRRRDAAWRTHGPTTPPIRTE